MSNGQVGRGHDGTMVRHFRGLDYEISLQIRLTRKGHHQPLQRLTQQGDPQGTYLLAMLAKATTVVLAVEEIRLFNAENLETTRFCFQSDYRFTADAEAGHIEECHQIRMKVIRAITAPESTVATVAFIPGDTNHILYTKNNLPDCWQKEVDTICTALVAKDQTSGVRHAHFDTKLCSSVKWSLNIQQLLQSSLEEVSLPDLDENGWRVLADGLPTNHKLRVLTVPYNRTNVNVFLQRQKEPVTESWTLRRQTTLRTLCISLPRSFPLRGDAEVVASMLHHVSSVSTFVIEYFPAKRMPELHEFANYIRDSLALAPNVRNLHLLVPFRSQDLRDHLKSMARTLSCLVLVTDRWSKTDLMAAQIMIRHSPQLEIFGLRRQDPHKGRSLYKRLRSLEVTKTGIIKYLGKDEADIGRTRTLRVRGRDDVDEALDDRLTDQANLYMELSAEGLALKTTHDLSELALERESEIRRRTTTTGKVSSHRTWQLASASGTMTRPPELSGNEVLVGATSSWRSPTDARNFVKHVSPIVELLNSGSAATTASALQPIQSGHQQGRHTQFSEFSFDQLAEATHNFDPRAVISGQVYFGKLALPDRSMKQVAVKDLNLEGVNCVRAVESFKSEAETLCRLRHENLVPLLGLCIHDRRRLLVYEFMPNNLLHNWIFVDDPQAIKLPWRTRVSIAEGVVNGLCYLHFKCNPTIIHMDIKPANILMDAREVPKLADFGIAKLVMDTEQNLIQALVSRPLEKRRYMAPEISQSNCLTTQSDVFSFGLLLMELVRGRRNSDMQHVDAESSLTFPLWAREMFRSGQHWRVHEQIMVPPLISGHNLLEAQKLLSIAIACINEDMKKRPNMLEVLRCML